MKTATCQVCGATAAIRDIGPNFRADPDYGAMQARCRNWPPPNQGGHMGASPTGCENLDQAVRMVRGGMRSPPRPIFW